MPNISRSQQRLHLLEDDIHYDQTVADAVISSTLHQFRSLFSILISTYFSANPPYLLNESKDNMAEDILHRVRSTMTNPQFEICAEIHYEVLISLAEMCVMMSGKMLHELGMPAPIRPIDDAFNREFEQKRQYDRNALSQFVRNKVPLLNQQQNATYYRIIKAVNAANRGIFCLMYPAELVKHS